MRSGRSPALRTTPVIEAVNFHVWQPCNMRCAFCFGSFRDVRRDVLPDGHLVKQDAMLVVAMLAEAGFQKITFSGGEPLLCPWLPDLVRVAKRAQMTTGIVTNGSLLTEGLLSGMRGSLDWVALSIDSVNEHTLRATGRMTAGRPFSAHDYLARGDQVRNSGSRLKINTVVTSANWQEDMANFIIEIRPLRWKVMNVLPIEGQNSGSVERLLTHDGQFDAFVARHEQVERSGITLIPERNDAMTESYAMVDPAGRFFDNSRGRYSYSKPILGCGVSTALEQVSISREKFLTRGGLYDWR